MARKKEQPPKDPEDELTLPNSPPITPWACEVEFFNKPSFMSSIIDIQIDKEHVSLTREDGSVIAFPYETVSKVLVMHTKKRQ